MLKVNNLGLKNEPSGLLKVNILRNLLAHIELTWSDQTNDTGSRNKTIPKHHTSTVFWPGLVPDAAANRPSAPVSSFVVNLTATPLVVLFS